MKTIAAVTNYKLQKGYPLRH